MISRNIKLFLTFDPEIPLWEISPKTIIQNLETSYKYTEIYQYPEIMQSKYSAMGEQLNNVLGVLCHR